MQTRLWVERRELSDFTASDHSEGVFTLNGAISVRGGAEAGLQVSTRPSRGI